MNAAYNVHLCVFSSTIYTFPAKATKSEFLEHPQQMSSFFLFMRYLVV